MAALEPDRLSPVVAAQIPKTEWVRLLLFGLGIQASTHIPPLSPRTWKTLATWVNGHYKSRGEVLAGCMPETDTHYQVPILLGHLQLLHVYTFTIP